MSTDPKSLASEIEAAQIIFEAIYPHLRYGQQSPENRKPFERAAAALQSRAFEDGAPKHVAEALRREAQQQAFQRALAESTYRRMRDKFLRAAHMAFAGNLCALRRIVDVLEDPKPIQGSASLQPEGERNA